MISTTETRTLTGSSPSVVSAFLVSTTPFESEFIARTSFCSVFSFSILHTKLLHVDSSGFSMLNELKSAQSSADVIDSIQAIRDSKKNQ